MPLFLASLLGGLVTVASSIVGRVLIALSIGYVSYSGLSSLLDTVKAQVIANLSGAPAQIVLVMGALKIDVVVSIIFSAFAARLIFMGLTSGKVTRMIVK